jgi:hypothetical protein
MVFIASYFLLGAVLLVESFTLAYVLRGTVSAALAHEVRRSSPIGLSPTRFPPHAGHDREQ